MLPPLPLAGEGRGEGGPPDRNPALTRRGLMQDPAALHAAIVTIDTHIDIPWPTGPDPFEDRPRGPGARRVDLPKMRTGGLGAGCFAAYVPQTARDPAAWTA